MTYVASYVGVHVVWCMLASAHETLCGRDVPLTASRFTNMLTPAVAENLCSACLVVRDATDEERKRARVAA
jgi:hypothetical protein